MDSFWLAKLRVGSAGYRERFCGRVVMTVLLLLPLAPFAVASDPLKLAEALHAEIIKLLPKQVGDFRQVGTIRSNDPSNTANVFSSNTQSPLNALVEYTSPDGAKLQVELVRFSQDADAYSFLTLTGRRDQPVAQLSKEVGTATVVLPESISFFKGRTFVRVYEIGAKKNDKSLELARLISERLESGEGDVPVLVKHLPSWEEAQQRLAYFARFKSLKDALPSQPILETVQSQGDADAVASTYGSAHLLIVEFNTPQLAADNDRAISAKIQELKQQGQLVPSAYRRIGNYSVFVFKAENEQTASALIDQIKYEQVVQWLGDNPNLLDRAQRDYYETTAGVLVAVVKASGLSLLACLAIGGIFGALLFSYRRAQQKTTEAYSDAGGMLRLNIDEMTPKSDPARLLGPGR
ncbi:MAG TPA: DUF6599 family protein [Pyrinomonadaceae bacterium]|nr:DUF6599 family protein [Pyrinomonadaceae bacterium]